MLTDTYGDVFGETRGGPTIVWRIDEMERHKIRYPARSEQSTFSFIVSLERRRCLY